jgi:hypothetical protein
MDIKLVSLCIGLAMALLVTGYALGGQIAGVPVIMALAALWLVGQWRGWHWVDAMGLAVYCGVAATGMWLGLGAGWMLAGLVVTLSAWDLAAFARWAQNLKPAEKAAVLVRQHLLRLLIVDAAGLLLAGAALTMRLRLGLALTLLLGLVAILGVSRVIAFLRHQTP